MKHLRTPFVAAGAVAVLGTVMLAGPASASPSTSSEATFSYTYDGGTPYTSTLSDICFALQLRKNGGETIQTEFGTSLRRVSDNAKVKFVQGSNSASNGDTISGGSGIQLIHGYGGNDKLTGGSSDDYICGGDGNDTIDAGSGNDQAIGGSGIDKLGGGSSNDRLDAGTGAITEASFGPRTYSVAGEKYDGGSGNDVLIFGTPALGSCASGSGTDSPAAC